MEEDKIQKILIRVVLEIAGHPKEHVESTMQKLTEEVKEKFDVSKFDVFEASNAKNIWSTFAEVEIYFEKTEDVIGFCLDYLPSSLEILEPDKMEMENFKLADILNDVVGRLHEYETAVRNLRAHNIYLKKKIDGEDGTPKSD
ncbi:hypothetical protein CL617_04655 [archaeon]|nr:hypothetical protein [archaeon]|tara:strand:+ start:5224 stop:5652 length:429 start_codon:yes stop_codon:yes gene_type:complete